MHTLILIGLLGAAAAEPVQVEVTTHPLASPATVRKGERPTTDLVPRAGHAMHARIDAQGRLQYDCAASAALPDLRFERRVMGEER